MGGHGGRFEDGSKALRGYAEAGVSDKRTEDEVRKFRGAIGEGGGDQQAESAAGSEAVQGENWRLAALNPTRRPAAFPPLPRRAPRKEHPPSIPSDSNACPTPRTAHYTMPPPVGRYGPSGLNAPFAHLQQAHLQQQQQHHPAHAQTTNAGLPPPSLGGHPGFAAGNPNSNINPFALSGAGISNGMPVAGFGGAGAGEGGGTGLASHAAQMGFARGAQMQQQQLHQAHDGRLALEPKAGAVKTRIREVWKHNLAQEMATLRQLVEKYPYISMVRLGGSGGWAL